MGLLTRLRAIENKLGGTEGCPECWRNMKDVNWEHCTIIVEGDAEAQIPTCPQCGRQPANVLVRRYGFDVEAV